MPIGLRRRERPLLERAAAIVVGKLEHPEVAPTIARCRVCGVGREQLAEPVGSRRVPLLAVGVAVSVVARRVGDANPSAFIAAFRRAVGVSPRSYFPH